MVINFYNAKGGTGKSSLSFLTANYLSQKEKVLLCDLDPQASTTRAFLNTVEGEPEYNLFQVLDESKKIKDCIFKINQNLDIIPSTLRVMKLQGQVYPLTLQNEFKKIKNIYKYIVLDNAPSFNNLIQSSILASDIVIVPTLVSLFDFHEVGFVLDEIKKINPGTDIKILLNRVNSKGLTKDDQDYIAQFHNSFNGRILNAIIPNTRLVARYIDRGEKVNNRAKNKQEFIKTFGDFITEITGERIDVEEF